jgi:hypothetical protein
MISAKAGELDWSAEFLAAKAFIGLNPLKAQIRRSRLHVALARCDRNSFSITFSDNVLCAHPSWWTRSFPVWLAGADGP